MKKIPERALSIRQPWAWLISRKFKTVENRNWATNFRGTVAIHASVVDVQFPEDWALDTVPELEKIWNDARVTKENPLFHLGAIIGTVDIIGCIKYDDTMPQDFEELCRAAGHGAWYDAQAVPPGAWANGSHCFLLDNAVEFAEPIVAKGKLNIWNMPPDLAANVALACKHGPFGSSVELRHKVAAVAVAK